VPSRILARFLALLVAAAACLALLGGSAQASLRWAPPPLIQPTTVSVTEDNHVLKLDPAKDYVVELPTDRPLRATGGLTIAGGRNVVLVGGEISIPYQGPAPGTQDRRALYLKGQTGTVHVEGLLLSGPDLNEGIDLDQRLGATVQIQNVRVEDAAPRDAADRLAYHTDIIQSWAGPERLRIDRLTGSTGYQGFFLQPTQFGTLPTQAWEISNVNLRGLPGAAYLLWKGSGVKVNASNLWLQPAPNRSLALSVWGPLSEWGNPSQGAPPGGDFVPQGAVGIGYRRSGAVGAALSAPAPSESGTAAPPAAAAPAPAPKPSAKRMAKACTRIARRRASRARRPASKAKRRAARRSRRCR
jgi:hypothetical protein